MLKFLAIVISLSFLVVYYIAVENGFGQNVTNKCPPGQAPVIYGNQSLSTNQTKLPGCKPIDAYNNLFSN